MEVVIPGSPDIAETGGKAIRVVKRNAADGSIETLRSINLGSSPDNIDVAADGSLRTRMS
jgi:hypothetical protein